MKFSRIYLFISIFFIFVSSAFAYSPATLQQTHLWHKILDHYRSLGMPTPNVPLYIGSPGELPDEWGAYTTQNFSISVPEDPTQPVLINRETFVVLNHNILPYINKLAAIPYGKSRMMIRCWDECEYVAQLLLHEAGHVAQFESKRIDNISNEWAENSTDAVALDQLWPILAKLVHKRMPAIARKYIWNLDIQPLMPRSGINTVRTISARATKTPWWSALSRRWRIIQLYSDMPALSYGL